jgi:4-hydroxy-tetrahydrodipicolinate synthase
MFTGSIVAIVTPMYESGEIDENSFRNLIKWHIAEGTKGIVVNGTTGESATLTTDERIKLIKIALEVCNDRIPVIAGTGTNSTVTTIDMTKKAIELGVSACLLVTPYYNKPTQAGLFEHFRIVAQKCNIPIILYNVPGRTGCDLLPETVIKLSKLDNIVGIKEATGDVSRVKVLRENCKSGFILLSGDDGTVLRFICAGGDGVISVAANIIPKEMAKLCDFAQNNKLKDAEQVDNIMKDLYRILFVESNPIPVKWALKQLGFIQEGIRSPLTKLSIEHRSALQSVLKQVCSSKLLATEYS